MGRSKKRLAAACTGMLMLLAATATALPSGTNVPMTANAAGKLLAFPGAGGAGRYTTGGRGGEIYHVTNLNDSGAGSLRDAVSKSNRVVVFDVSGTIVLSSNIVCTSNVTVLGQTAPGGAGVTLKNYKWGMGGTNCIVRYVSSRPGPDKGTSSGNDAWGGAEGGSSIIDHCSMGWTTDEQWGLYSNNNDYTLQYSVIGPANSWGGHVKGVHGFGIMFGQKNFSFDHNLICHCVSRNFRGKVPDQNAADFTNNVIYDWGYQTTYGTIGHVNYVNNTLKAGNSTTGAYHYAQVSNSENFQLFLTGNRILNKDNSVRNAESANWSAIEYKSGKTEAGTKVDAHFPITVGGEDLSSSLTAESSVDSYDHVLTYAGNGVSSDKRTKIDQQCANECLTGTGQCSGTSEFDSTQTDLTKYNIKCGVTYEYPSSVLTKDIVDSDNDGMPDEWEEARGLNPNDASDASGDYCGQGYMNIEYYANDLTVDSFPVGVVELSPSNGGVQIDPISAFETIEAENFDLQSGVTAETQSNGKGNIGFVENGDWTMYRKVDFADGAKAFSANISGNVTKIELYLDSSSGTPAATFNFAGTTGFSDYQTVSCNIPTITGTHNLYLKFTGGEGYLCNLDSFVFAKEAIPLSGKLFKNVKVAESANPNAWLLAENAATGALVFGDRPAVTIATLANPLNGAEVLLTSCDAKAATGDVATFTAGADMTLYVAFDSRVTTIPAWVSGYTKTDLTYTTSNEVTFIVYSKAVKAGEQVTLGGNGQASSCVNYNVMATSSSAIAPVAGDVNADGTCSIADLILLQKWVLGGNAVMSDWSAGDLNGNNRLDVFDLCALKRVLLKK